MLFSSPLIFTAIRGCQPGIRECYLAIRGFLQVSVDFTDIRECYFGIHGC